MEEESSGQGYKLSDTYTLTGLTGTRGEAIEPLDFVTRGISNMNIQYWRDHDTNRTPDCIDIFADGPDGKSKILSSLQPETTCTDSKWYKSFLWSNIWPASATAVQVCDTDNDDNHMIRGIELRGHDIGADGSFGFFRQNGEEESRCRRRDAMQVCPVDSIASGVYLHWVTKSTFQTRLTGLRLICRQVVPE